MILFRTDGNPEIGAGHIMRCLAIANSARDYGETCLFMVSSNHFQDIIVDNGHNIEILNSDYQRMGPEEILPALEEYIPRVVFVDSYFVTEDYLCKLQMYCDKKGSRLVYVDDRCSTPYSCDYLLNYNIFSRINDYTKLYSTKKSPVYMLGTKYAPLRKEFENCCKRDTSQKAKNIFVSTGGADAEHFTVDMVKKAAEKTEYCFHIVVGRMNRDNKLLSEKAEQIGNIIIHENVESMAELMCSCEVAISAAGSTLYELCATQTPSITYVLADNQIPAAEEFDSRKIIRNCGDIRDLGKRILAENLIEEAIALAENYDERKRLSEQMGYIVDGKGTSRILEQVLHI